MSAFLQVRTAMLADAARLGWHLHGSAWVWGICPHDGCPLCDALEAFWLPRLGAAPTEAPTTVDAARRARIAVAKRLGIALIVTPAPIAVPLVVTPAAVVPTPQTVMRLDDPPAAGPLQLDDEIADAPAPAPSLPPTPTFALTHPTAESLRRHRKKRS